MQMKEKILVFEMFLISEAKLTGFKCQFLAQKRILGSISNTLS